MARFLLSRPGIERLLAAGYESGHAERALVASMTAHLPTPVFRLLERLPDRQGEPGRILPGHRMTRVFHDADVHPFRGHADAYIESSVRVDTRESTLTAPLPRYGSCMESPAPFSGSKIALFKDRDILVYRRDDKPDIPFPGLWDLPGGGREGNETPEACVLRELHEEFGLTIPGSRIGWSRVYPSSRPDRLPHWFFAGWLSAMEIAAIRFGNEGQEWTLMDVDAYLQLTDAITHLQARVTDYLNR
ncbi:NUDIX hydrolase [Burkholderia cepacia]|uniref:NUDIX hydrolase n=2 Tax=Burkholderiaceae TaxID=119060 RepID=UPI001CE2A6C9|nr:NUDIX hydrolase [Burkholderia cepacia]